MKLIDEELGGTTPLEVIIKFPKKEKVKKSGEDDEFDDWGDEEDTNDEKYWFTKDKIDLITSVHNYFCLLYTSPSPRDRTRSRMPSSA